MKNLWLALLLLIAAPAALADQSVRAGGYVVRYAALKTTDLSPTIAQQFGVQQGSAQALLVINAQRELPGGRSEQVPASAKGTARSFTGHVQALALRAVSVDGGHDVIAGFEVLDREFVTFELVVTPQGGPEIPVKFQQQFFLD